MATHNKKKKSTLGLETLQRLSTLTPTPTPSCPSPTWPTTATPSPSPTTTTPSTTPCWSQVAAQQQTQMSYPPQQPPPMAQPLPDGTLNTLVESITVLVKDLGRLQSQVAQLRAQSRQA